MDEVENRRQPAMYSFYKRSLIEALDGKGEYTVAGLLSDMPDDIRDAIIAEDYEDYGPTYVWRNA